MRVEALDELLVRAELHFVVHVPTGTREDAWPSPGAPSVGDDVGAALDRIQRAVHAAPIPDGEDVLLLGALDDDGRPLHALVGHRVERRLARDGGVGVVRADLPAGGRLLAGEAHVARRLAAGARRGGASFAAGRRAVVKPLKVLAAGLMVVHAGDSHHVLEPFVSLRVILPAAEGDPVDDALAIRVTGVVQYGADRALGDVGACGLGLGMDLEAMALQGADGALFALGVGAGGLALVVGNQEGIFHTCAAGADNRGRNASRNTDGKGPEERHDFGATRSKHLEASNNSEKGSVRKLGANSSPES
mmetsp:Transcript_44155/g.113632  ORF Transcript_44155/g.113632 Transcript_44155/m.113632 type:complete len:305 (+) Transcript_44155:1205-2119(+)